MATETTYMNMQAEIEVEGKLTTVLARFTADDTGNNVDLLEVMDGSTNVEPFMGFIGRQKLKRMISKELKTRMITQNIKDCVNNNGRVL